MKNSSNSGNGGVGLLGLLTVAFVVLKLTGVIAWSWWWVLAPAWIPLAVGLVITVIVMIVGLVAAVGKKG
ncbi:hypothetical protein [Timonella senegalensis]|uniref:hypothetical protein n=1 Tax=Timonella senegalensis TaxID=1465825 RepID=UPI0028B192A8|nr:hypothetical protein [Timonella senegalensis]